MKQTAREALINDGLDKHFRTNHGAWYVTDDHCDNSVITLHHKMMEARHIDPLRVAAYIIRKAPEIKTVAFMGGAWNITRKTLDDWEIRYQ